MHDMLVPPRLPIENVNTKRFLTSLLTLFVVFDTHNGKKGRDAYLILKTRKCPFFILRLDCAVIKNSDRGSLTLEDDLIRLKKAH